MSAALKEKFRLEETTRLRLVDERDRAKASAGAIWAIAVLEFIIILVLAFRVW